MNGEQQSNNQDEESLGNYIYFSVEITNEILAQGERASSDTIRLRSRVLEYPYAFGNHFCLTNMAINLKWDSQT